MTSIPSLPVSVASVGKSANQGSTFPSLGGKADFGATFAEMLKESAQTVVQGEAVALSGLQGKASVQQVVQSVMQAEQTLQSMVAIRDKIVGAYLEISRMQI